MPGLGSGWGISEAGKLADVVVTASDPLQANIRSLEDVRNIIVIQGGRLVKG